MRAKVYVASGFGNAPMARYIMDRLEALRFRITFDWTVNGAVKGKPLPVRQDIAQSEVRGVTAAKFIVVALPGGLGTHVEIGMALAQGKKVYIFAPRRVDVWGQHYCNFYDHPLVKVYTDLNELIDEVELAL